MARFSVHVALMLVLACGTIGSSTALSLEQKLKELESRLITKIHLLESKNAELEGKMTQLETQLEQNNEEREELALQVTGLKAKVQQQETILFSLLNEKKKPLADVNDLSSTYQSEVSVNGLPSSCADLKMVGHILNGFYSVMGNTTMESVYCDFTKPTSDTGFQKWIGYVDVKSTPVHFCVYRSSAFVPPSSGPPFVTFNAERLNVGNAMDGQSGIFTAPRPGIYFFSFVTQAEFPASTSTLRVSIHLLENGYEVGRAEICETNTVANQKSPLTLMSTLNLKPGDQVFLLLEMMPPGVSLNGDGSPFTTYFTGFLLEEEIVASL